MAHPRHSFTSPLRYPGGKGALSNFIKLLFIDNGLLDGHYVEAYAGGAAVAWLGGALHDHALEPGAVAASEQAPIRLVAGRVDGRDK